MCNQRIHRPRFVIYLAVYTTVLVLLAPSFQNMSHAQVLSKKTLRSDTEQASSLIKIERAYATGTISLDQRALYTASALFAPDRLPAEFQGVSDEGCGTPVRSWFFQVWPDLSQSTRRQLEAYGFQPNGALARPKGLDSVRTTTHFQIHYSVAKNDTNAVDTTDANNNGTPDYIDMIMRLLEEVYTTMVDSMKYTVMPPDTVINGKWYYDVYVYKLGKKIYGYVQPEKAVGDNPNSNGRVETNAAYSYMGLRNNYQGFEGDAERNLKVTIAHELFHAFQSGYDVYEKAWLKEATATWVEDELYDEINDNYQYLPKWFDRPWEALDATSEESYKGHWYGSWIFFRYLSEHVGNRDIVRKVWEHSVSYNSKNDDFSINAVSDAISDYNKTFGQVFLDFQLANLLKTMSPYDYEEGENYPDIYRNVVYDSEYEYSTYNMRLSADFYEILLPHSPMAGDKVEITVDKLDSLANFRVQVVSVSGNQVNVTRFNPRTQSTHRIDNLNGLDRLYAVVVNINTKGKKNDYRIRVKRTIALTQIVSGFFVAKNPFSIAAQVGDTLRVLRFDNQYTVTRIVQFKQSPSKDLIAYRTKNDDIVIIYNSKTVKIIPDSNWTVQEIGQMNEIASIEGTTVWLVGGGVYRAFPQGASSFRLKSLGVPGIGNLSYRRDEEKLIADDNIAIWLDAYWTDPGGNSMYHSDFWRAIGDNATRFRQFQTENVVPIVADWTFQDSVLVYVNRNTGRTTPDLVMLDVQSGAEAILDQPNGITRFATARKRVAWSVGESVYLWQNGTTTVVVEGDSLANLLGAYYPWFEMDSSGIAWLKVTSPDGQTLNPTFYFYDFRNQTIYEARFTNFNLYRLPDETRRGDRIILRDGMIYFTAMDLNASVQWPYVYSVDMRRQVPTGITRGPERVPVSFDLKPNYPNPFRDQTTLRIVLPQASPVEIRVYDVLGRLVYSRHMKRLEPGEHRIALKAQNWGSGMYFYRIKVGAAMKSGKMLIVR